MRRSPSASRSPSPSPTDRQKSGVRNATTSAESDMTEETDKPGSATERQVPNAKAEGGFERQYYRNGKWYPYYYTNSETKKEAVTVTAEVPVVTESAGDNVGDNKESST